MPSMPRPTQLTYAEDFGSGLMRYASTFPPGGGCVPAVCGLTGGEAWASARIQC